MLSQPATVALQDTCSCGCSGPFVGPAKGHSSPYFLVYLLKGTGDTGSPTLGLETSAHLLPRAQLSPWDLAHQASPLGAWRAGPSSSFTSKRPCTRRTPLVAAQADWWALNLATARLFFPPAKGMAAATLTCGPASIQVLTPVGYQWDFWKDGNANKATKPTKEKEMEMRIYKELEKDPRIHPDELHSYGVSAGLLDQDDNIITMLHRVVEIYNRMATTRRRYLFKKIHGAWGKEMSLMLTRITKDKELADTLVADIVTVNGYCPPAPTVFADLPKFK